MGLPIKHRKKYVSHKKRWDKRTIDEESVLVTDYALKNKREIRKIEFDLSKFKNVAKELNRTLSIDSPEVQNFMKKMKNLGYLAQDATSLDNVLDISLRDILDRRLSNIVYKQKIARSASQARQFIVHRHIKVNGKIVNSPSYSVSLEEEKAIEVIETSSLADENHPERRDVVPEVVEEVKEEEETKVEEIKAEETTETKEVKE